MRDIKLQPQEEIQLEAGVRAGSLSESGKFVAGLEDSTIVELDLKGDRSVAKVLEAHSAAKMEELWGLCMSPVNDNEFVTCGDDSRVFKWDMANRSAVNKV